jgi:carboxyl-terminal processing protease
VLEEFVKYAVNKGVQRDNEGLKASSRIINTQLKAYIARNIIGEQGFYPIIQKIDNTLIRAIEISKQNLLVENINGNQEAKIK